MKDEEIKARYQREISKKGIKLALYWLEQMKEDLDSFEDARGSFMNTLEKISLDTKRSNKMQAICMFKMSSTL